MNVLRVARPGGIPLDLVPVLAVCDVCRFTACAAHGDFEAYRFGDALLTICGDTEACDQRAFVSRRGSGLTP